MSCLETCFSSGLVVLGGWLDLILKIFSNLNDSMTQQFYDTTPNCNPKTKPTQTIKPKLNKIKPNPKLVFS